MIPGGIDAQDAKLDPALDVLTARQGVADLETPMPMLFSEGVVTGRITMDQFVPLTSARAARAPLPGRSIIGGRSRVKNRVTLGD